MSIFHGQCSQADSTSTLLRSLQTHVNVNAVAIQLNLCNALPLQLAGAACGQAPYQPGM